MTTGTFQVSNFPNNSLIGVDLVETARLNPRSSNLITIATPTTKQIYNQSIVSREYVNSSNILFDTNTWMTETRLIPSSSGSGFNFGSAVSISGDYAVVGAKNQTVGGNANQGRAFIFERSNSEWKELQTIIASAGVVNENFGTSVSIDGEFIAIGAPGPSSTPGAVYLFQNNNTWTEIVKLTGNTNNDQFGSSVFLFNNYLVIGAKNYFNGANNIGAIYLYGFINNTWTFLQTITASDSASGDAYGSCVAMYNEYIVVGAPNKGTTNGQAYILKKESNLNIWEEYDILYPASPSTLFGSAVSIYDNTISIGVPNEDVIPYTNNGIVEIYTLSAGTWSNTQTLNGSATNAFFGTAVSVSGKYLVIGAPGMTVNGVNSGVYYVYTKNAITWNLLSDIYLNNYASNAGAEFGKSLYLNGNYLIVGSPSITTGFCYMYEASQKTGSIYINGQMSFRNRIIELVRTVNLTLTTASSLVLVTWALGYETPSYPNRSYYSASQPSRITNLSGRTAYWLCSFIYSFASANADYWTSAGIAKNTTSNVLYGKQQTYARRNVSTISGSALIPMAPNDFIGLYATSNRASLPSGPDPSNSNQIARLQVLEFFSTV